MQKTLIIIKPDGVQRQLIGRIISRFEEKGMQLVGMKMVRVNTAQAKRLYAVHKGKHFYKGLIKYITAAPVVAMVIAGYDTIKICRKILGATFGPDAEPGTIRGDFGASVGYNLVHASDSPQSATKEIPVFFKANEILTYTPANLNLIYHPDEELKSSKNK